MGLLKFLLIIVVVYYSFKLLFRILFPFLLNYFVKKTENNFFGGNAYGENQNQKQEGEVTIDYSPSDNKKKKTPDDDGEYVDFEELD